MTSKRICEILDCDNVHKAYGWCSMHYKRWKIHGDPLGGGRHYKTPDEAFEARTKLNTDTGCLEWTGSCNTCGYGQIKVNGKMVKVHRYAWEREHGPIPKGNGSHGTCVLHRCDNTKCCEKSHLFLGSHQDNMVDMLAKGRGNPLKGSDVNLAKLTEPDIPLIRADTRFLREIAVDYGVGLTTISNIKNRKTWSHIK